MKNLEFIIPEAVTPTEVFRFGVVTGVNPLRVKLDGDTAPASVTPIITASVTTGDRVLVQIHNRQLMVVGRVGGYWGVQPIGPGQNLNDYDQTGVYHQAHNSDAASGSNYPTASAGMLEVTRGDGGGQVFQRYTRFLSDSVYTRSRYNGTWNSWKRVVTEDDSGKATVQRLRLTATDDASETSTGHAFQIGPDSGQNTVMDDNEIIGRDNGALRQIWMPSGIDGLPKPVNTGSAANKQYVDQRYLTGSVNISPSAANTPTSATVTFPAGRFASAPTVMVTPSTTVPGSTVTGWAATDATATSVKLWVTRTNTTSTLLNWVAYSND